MARILHRPGSFTGLLAVPLPVLVLAPALAAGEMILWIRTGDHHAAELIPDPGLTPALRQLTLDGSSLPWVSLGGADASALEPAAVKDRLLPPDVLGHLRKQGISEVVLLPRAGDAPAAPRQEGGAGVTAAAAVKSRPLARLIARFGEAPPPSEAERQFTAELRRLLGLEPANRAGPVISTSATAAAPAVPPPELDPVARVTARVSSALEKGARLVILLAPCEATGELGTVERRDALLRALIDRAREAGSTSLGVLSIPAGGAETPGMFFLRGPGVRAGWVVPERVPLERLTANILWLLGSQPMQPSRSEDLLHEIQRPNQDQE